jgi:hypothetical protein
MFSYSLPLSLCGQRIDAQKSWRFISSKGWSSDFGPILLTKPSISLSLPIPSAIYVIFQA